MAQDGRAHDLGVALGRQDLDAPEGVVLLVGPALVVEVVEEAGEPPELLVLALEAGVVAHGGLDGQGVLAQAFLLRVLAEELPGLVAAGKAVQFGHGA